MTADNPATSLPADARLDLSDVSFESDDDLYRAPYVDVDEHRSWPLVHRYIHGGFEGTENRFSFYVPTAGATRVGFSSTSPPCPRASTSHPA